MCSSEGGFTWRVSRNAVKDERTYQRERDEEERRERRVRLLRGFLSEVEENLAVHPSEPGGEIIIGGFVRDMWSRAQEEVGTLPDEVVDALRLAYAQAVRYDELVLWAQSKSLGRLYGPQVQRQGEEAHERFDSARDVLAHWLGQLHEG